MASVITKRAALKLRFVSDADISARQKVTTRSPIGGAERDGILPRRIDVRAIADNRIGVS
ncbi:hypothetical protein [Ralstonia solanacearum]|uniref:hypothetical protein n=1 Tax=Ralstonia solanacearum TaxID=305 RepID=UPI002E1B256A